MHETQNANFVTKQERLEKRSIAINLKEYIGQSADM